MRQRRPFATGEHRCHRTAESAAGNVADRVDARVDRDQIAAKDLVTDPAGRCTELEQLPAHDMTELAVGKLADLGAELALFGHSL